MRDGHYRLVFTTNTGTLGEGACYLLDGRYVGADFFHSYWGTIEMVGEELKAVMHCTRQPAGLPFSLELPTSFEMAGTGRETDEGFAITTELPGGTVLTATWMRIFPAS